MITKHRPAKRAATPKLPIPSQWPCTHDCPNGCGPESCDCRAEEVCQICRMQAEARAKDREIDQRVEAAKKRAYPPKVKGLNS
jgi:hypothetical protein